LTRRTNNQQAWADLVKRKRQREHEEGETKNVTEEIDRQFKTIHLE